MTDAGPKPARLPLPRDAFRAERIAASAAAAPVVVMPTYDDLQTGEARPPSAQTVNEGAPAPGGNEDKPRERKPIRPERERVSAPRNPFEAYGERSSARPYALRLPDAIDLTLRQMAAEERTHPLRIIDRILYDHLKRTGKLPPI